MIGYNDVCYLTRNFKCGGITCLRCRSLGCYHSKNYVPVENWNCYPKDKEND